MKNIVKILVASAIAFTGVSCEDFLDAKPVEKISSEAFFVREMDFILYCNGMLDLYGPSASTVGMGDNYTDLTASKSSTDFYKPGAAWDASKQGGWDEGSWKNIRRANVMLRDMVRAKENVSAEIYNHYEGVARFWRAYFYFAKVKSFSNVPWIDHPLDVDDPLLYAGRDDREFVMSKVLEDLNFAGDNCLATDNYERSVITRWAVLAFKARVCLYEGTFRKYHKVNPATNEPWNNQYGTSEDFLQAAVDAAQTIMTESGIQLHNDYHSLFVSTDLTKIPEALWYREYLSSETLNVWHDLTLQYNTATASQKVSPTKTLMNMYLKTDGTPISTDEVSLNDEFTGRDPRLAATVQCPGHQWTMAGVTGPKPLRFTWTVTGYMFTKWNQETEENYINGRNDNWVPILRYAEVLLAYAEAKAELNDGELSQEDWNKTVGALRIRAGVENIWPKDAKYKEDAWLKNYYGRAQGAAVTNLSNTILEIRRERATELILEGVRSDDLFRWHCGNLIVDRADPADIGWRGLYLTADDVKNGFEFNGEKFTFTNSGTNDNNYQISNNTSDNNWSISNGTHGYLIYHQAMVWDEKRYVRPIPTSAQTRNPNLGQNYGWN